MRLGSTPFNASGHAHLGDAALLESLTAFIHEGPPPEDPAPVVPHDPQMAVLTLAIKDLTDAVLALTQVLSRRPWYMRLWDRLTKGF